MKHYIIIAFSVFLFFSCKKGNEELTAQQIIDKTIEASGSAKVKNVTLHFDFHDISYRAIRENGIFELSRTFKEGDSVIFDKLSNNGFVREINGKTIKISDSLANVYSESVNSVHYFSVLPFGLNDKAVNKKLIGEAKIKTDNYYKVLITFDQEGGGVDYEDEFIYWINKSDFQIDYLAYTFHVNGGGIRFREVTKESFIEGIRFVNYNNYKSKSDSVKISKLENLFLKDELEKVSEINLENIQVIK